LGIASLIGKLVLSLNTIFRKAENGKKESSSIIDALEYNLHLHYFTLSQIRHLLEGFNFRIDKIEGRTLSLENFCSRYIEIMLKLIELNIMLGSNLPLSLVSG
jgi:hypothetical protein